MELVFIASASEYTGRYSAHTSSEKWFLCWSH